MKHVVPYLWVGVGGFVGANVRYLLANVAQKLLGIGFPYGTFFINVTGSFLLGVILTILEQRALPHSNEIRLAVAVGFLGSYTTFSTFEYECHGLLEDGEWALALLNVFGSLFVGLLALRVGMIVARQWS